MYEGTRREFLNPLLTLWPWWLIMTMSTYSHLKGMRWDWGCFSRKTSKSTENMSSSLCLFVVNNLLALYSRAKVRVSILDIFILYWNLFIFNQNYMCQSLKGVWRERLMLVPRIPIVWVMLRTKEWGGLSFRHRLVISLHLLQYTFVCTFVSEMRDLLDNRDNCLIHCVCYLPIYSMKIISTRLQS